MGINRREFNRGLTAGVVGVGAASTHRALGADTPAKPDSETGFSRFYRNPAFEILFVTALGRAYHSGGNVGKILYLAKQVKDGDFEGAFQAFKLAGDEARALAEESLTKHHKESARQAYLWAQNYYDTATYFVDGSKDPTRFQPTWELLYDCWLKSLPLFESPIEPVEIPYENTKLHGFYFKGKGTAVKRPLLILANGSDGSLLDMWLWGGAGALARGYDCLTFDGPGQGYALWKQKLYFRPDWEKVITPVVDYALTRKEVDPKRIAIQGVSQGGYWVPRAVAFEKRIAAAIADPGVVDVSTSWDANLPKPLVELIDAGNKAEFDGVLAESMSPAEKATLTFRMRPYGVASYYDAFKAARQYNLKDVAARIECPMLITNPASENYWPGQSQELFDLIRGPKQLVSFSASDGADLHCEPNGTGLRDLRVFNWLDETLR